MRRHKFFAFVLAFLLLCCAGPAPAGTASAGAAAAPQGFVLTIAHVNDTHSHLEPEATVLHLQGRDVAVRLGGFARLKTALDAARAQALAEGDRFLALHAGDAVQGTLFFNVFHGRADFDFLNMLGLSAMTLGNHEFDRGPEFTAGLVRRAAFPVVSADVDAAAVPALAAVLKPYVVVNLRGVRVGIVGATTPETANVSDPGAVRFLDPVPAVAQAVREARARGARVVVLLSHLGYPRDLDLARRVAGINVIVGGHTHSLLGDSAALQPLGLSPEGPYPTVVRAPDGRKVLVVQAWCWGLELGLLRVRFDAAGRVVDFSGRPELLAGGGFSIGGRPVPAGSAEYAALQKALLATGAARVVAEDPEVLRRLAPLARQLDAFRNDPVGATAAVDLVRNTATDPGPLVADAFLAAVPGSQIALLMPGNVRADILAGPVTRGGVLNVLPFDETVCSLEVGGAELKAALEEAVAFTLAKHRHAGASGRRAFFYAAGLSCRIDPAAEKGARVLDLRVRGAKGRFAPVDPAATYRLVTNGYLAGGGDGLSTLKTAKGPRKDTHRLCSDVLAAYLRTLGTVRPPERRVLVVAPAPLSLLLRPAVRPFALAA